MCNKSEFIQMLSTMLKTQDALNTSLDPDWKDKGWDFQLAIKVELFELIDQLNYKWWKQERKADGTLPYQLEIERDCLAKLTPKQLQQAQLEVVDIFHFALSDYIVQRREHTLYGLSYFESLYHHSFKPKTQHIFEHIKSCSIFGLSLYNPSLYQLMFMLDLNFTKLYKMYMAKQLLNTFRWLNGYGNGTYVKIWNGKEDNEYLMEILDQYEVITESDEQEIMQKLQDTYFKIV